MEFLTRLFATNLLSLFFAHLSLLLQYCFLPTFLCYYCFLPTFLYCYCFFGPPFFVVMFFTHLYLLSFFCPTFFVVIVYILHVDLLRLLGGVGGVVQPLLGSLLLAAQAGHFPLEHGDPLSPDPRHPALLSRCMANNSSTLFCCKIKPLSIETIGTRPTLPVADFI